MYSTLTLLVCVGLTFGSHLPPEIDICKISDPNFKECLISSANKAIVALAKGNQELTIRPLDPLRIEQVTIEPRPGPFNIYQKYTDIVIEGLSLGTVEDFGINFDDCKIWLNLTANSLRGTANYKLKGKLLLLPIDAQGKLLSVTKDFGLNVIATCEKFTKDEKQYLRIVNSNTKLNVKNIKFNFGVLLNGNPQLDKELHNVIDDNPEDFFEVMRPSIETLWNAGIFDRINSIFTQFSLDELFKN